MSMANLTLVQHFLDDGVGDVKFFLGHPSEMSFPTQTLGEFGVGIIPFALGVSLSLP